MKKSLITAVLLLIVALPLVTLAQTEIGLNGVGARIGYIMPEGDIENTLGFGLNADMGSFNKTIKLFAYLDYWGKGYDLGYWEWSWSVIDIAAIAKYPFETQGNLKPYVGGGLGLSFNHWSSNYKGPSSPYFSEKDFEASATDTEFAIHLLGGADMELSPKMVGFAEVKYTIAGNADYFGIFVGINYKLK